eukprot:Em0022g910a
MFWCEGQLPTDIMLGKPPGVTTTNTSGMEQKENQAAVGSASQIVGHMTGRPSKFCRVCLADANESSDMIAELRTKASSMVFRIAYCGTLRTSMLDAYQGTCDAFVQAIKEHNPTLREFGPTSAYNTERCEAFNSLVRCHNPSRDIGGRYGPNNERCSPAIRELFKTTEVLHFMNGYTPKTHTHGEFGHHGSSKSCLMCSYIVITRPADILLSNWFLGKPAALDVSITSPLNPLTLLEAGVLTKSAAQVTEARKHQANDPKCSELGWVCVPMVAESYGAWGDEASSIISSIASRLATSTCKSKSVVLNDIYGRLNVHLVRANATAILSRIIPLS